MIISEGALTWPAATVGQPADTTGAAPADIAAAALYAQEWLSLQTAGIYGVRAVVDRPMSVFGCSGASLLPPVLRSIYDWGRGWPFDTDPRTGFLSSNQIIELEGDAVSVESINIFVGPNAAADPAVTLPGGLLNPASYRLEGNYLIRQDGWIWPTTQNMINPVSQADTWTIHYTRGVPVPPLGQRAMQLLTNEILKAISGQKGCKLPFNATTVSRAGVTINRDVLKAMTTSGVDEVDRWVAMVNPNGLMGPPRVWSPDVPRHGQPYSGSYYGGAPTV